MSEKKDPTLPESNDEKFKPQKVTDPTEGNISHPGRSDRDMQGISRGSERGNRRSAQHRR